MNSSNTSAQIPTMKPFVRNTQSSGHARPIGLHQHAKSDLPLPVSFYAISTLAYLGQKYQAFEQSRDQGVQNPSYSQENSSQDCSSLLENWTMEGAWKL